MLSTKFNRQLKLIFCTCLISFIQFNIGCSFIMSSFLLANLREPSSPIKISSEDASWIASVPMLITPAGLIVIGILTDKIGRRKALQVAYIPISISWLVLANANSYETIIVGRIIMGSCLGSGACSYLYLAEVCPAKYRQLYFSVSTIFIGVGMMTECILSMFLHWNSVSAVMFVVSSTSCLTLFILPETPKWLRARGRVRDAEDAEKWFCIEPPPVTTTAMAAVTVTGNNNNNDNRNDDDNGDKDDDDAKKSRVCWAAQLARPTMWKPTLIALVFFVLQQCSGFYVMLFYSMDVLHDCRVQWDGITVTTYLAVARVLGSLVYFALYHVRRCTLIVVSSTGMAASLFAIVAYMRLYRDVADPPYGTVPIVAFVTYVFFALLAMLPMPWTIVGEIFPMDVKGTMNGVVQTFGYELMFLVIKVYPSLVSTFGIECIWMGFASGCLLCALYGAFIMPETKGKSIDDILKSFEARQKSIKNNLP